MCNDGRCSRSCKFFLCTNTNIKQMPTTTSRYMCHRRVSSITTKPFVKTLIDEGLASNDESLRSDAQWASDVIMQQRF